MRSTSALGSTEERDRLLALLVLRHGLKLRAALGLYPQDIDGLTGEVRTLPGGVQSVQLDAQGLALFGRWLEARARIGVTAIAPLFCTTSESSERERGQPLQKSTAEWILRQTRRR